MKFDKFVRFVIAIAFFVLAILFAVGAIQTIIEINDIVSVVYGW